MVEVSLSEKGSARYAIQGISTLGDAEPMYVTECFRCIGILIILVRKPEVKALTAQYVAAGFHVPPGNKGWTRAVCRNIFKEINYLKINYRALIIGICGGKIDTPANQKFYGIMQGQLIAPLKRMFPEVPVLELKPEPQTDYSTMYMDEEFHLLIEQFE